MSSGNVGGPGTRSLSRSFHHSASYSFAHAAKRLNFLGKGEILQTSAQSFVGGVILLPRCDLFMALVTPGLFSSHSAGEQRAKRPALKKQMLALSGVRRRTN